MKKSDLKTGMVVKLKNGNTYLVLKGNLPTRYYGYQELMFINKDSFIIGDGYTESLEYSDSEWSVESVYIKEVMGLEGLLNCEDSLKEIKITQKKIVSIEEIAEKFGVSPEQLTIVQ